MAVDKKGQDNTENNKIKDKIKKYLTWLFYISIPIFIFVVIPLITRNYYKKSLKISEDIFLGSPEKINLVETIDEKTLKVGPCYTVTINGYTFSIPEKYIPTKINYNEAEFRLKSRTEGRYIYILAEKITRTMKFKTSFINKLFLPSELRDLLPLVLNANWHPYRLMFKAHLYSNEGINSKIFKANFGENHIGYIFPSPGNEGYLGRIFRMDGDGTVDFLVSDSVTHVTLRDWVNIARLIKMPSKTNEHDDLPENDNNLLLDKLIEEANDEKKQTKVLSQALNEFYTLKESEWLIPIAIVMWKRGFIPELLDLINEYHDSIDKKSKYYKKLNEILDNSVKESISIEIDPISDLRELNLYCKNLTNLDISQITLEITVVSKFNMVQNFTVKLLKQNTLRSNEEKQIQIKAPSDVSISNAAKINYRVTALEFAK